MSLKISGKRSIARGMAAPTRSRKLKRIGNNRNIFPAQRVFALDDFVTGDESLGRQFQWACAPDEPNWSAHINDRPSKRGLRHRRSPFRWSGLAARRFPDAAKHFMVAESLWLLTSSFVKSKAYGSASARSAFGGQFDSLY